MIGSFALKPCGEELKTHHPGLAGFVQRKPRLAPHPVVCRVLRHAKPACGRGGSCLVSKSTRAAAHPRVTHEGAQRCLLTSPATEGGPAPLALRRTPSDKRALPSLHVPERHRPVQQPRPPSPREPGAGLRGSEILLHSFKTKCTESEERRSM